MSYRKSSYSEQKNSAIRFNIMGALGELAKFSGVDINTLSENCSRNEKTN